MSINSRSKGKRGEYEVRDLFKEHGFPARRGAQFQGGPESPDVVVNDLPWIHVEVKFVQNLNIEKAMNQSRKDSSDEQMPVVIHRKVGTKWLVTMEVEDFFELVINTHDKEQHERLDPKHSGTTEPEGCLTTTDASVTVSNSASSEVIGNPST